MVGDVAHNLRSALDHLACQLFLASGRDDCANTEFPIYWEGNRYATAGRGKVAGIADPALAVIDRLQPYLAGDRFYDDPLYLVHQFDRIDKHRGLLLVGCAVGAHNLVLSTGAEEITVFSGPWQIRPLEDGAELHGSFRFAKAVPKVQVRGEQSFEIAFEEGDLGGGRLSYQRSIS